MNEKLLDDLFKRVAKLEDQAKKATNNPAPTLPIYDLSGGSVTPSTPGSVPQDAVPGQVALGTDGALHHTTDGTTWKTAAAGGGGGSILLSSLRLVPLMALQSGALEDSGGGSAWNPLLDTNALGNNVFTNSRNGLGGSSRTPALNDYFTFPDAFGPKGSTWAIFGNWRLSSDGGIFKIELASVPDTAGQLESSPGMLNYLNPLVLGGNNYFDDTYNPGAPVYEGASNVFSQVFTIGGDDGAPFTAVIGLDGLNNPIINGGAGNYKWKLKVTGKNTLGPSSGYRVDLMWLAVARLDDGGLI